MTKLLEEAIARLRSLPQGEQDAAAELVMDVMAHDAGTVVLTPQQQAEVRRRLERVDELASHDRVRAYFKKQAV